MNKTRLLIQLVKKAENIPVDISRGIWGSTFTSEKTIHDNQQNHAGGCIVSVPCTHQHGFLGYNAGTPDTRYVFNLFTS